MSINVNIIIIIHSIFQIVMSKVLNCINNADLQTTFIWPWDTQLVIDSKNKITCKLINLNIMDWKPRCKWAIVDHVHVDIYSNLKHNVYKCHHVTCILRSNPSVTRNLVLTFTFIMCTYMYTCISLHVFTLIH